MNRNYKTINQLDITMDDLVEWTDGRNTDIVVALAIHAIADSTRPAKAIWADPTPSELDHVLMAITEYIEHGDFKAYEAYSWGEDVITLEE